MCRIFWVAVFVLTIAPTAKSNEPLKAEVSFVPHTTGGRIVGCGIRFTAIFRDFTYRKGNLVGVDGGMNWMFVSDQKAVFGMFKLALSDFDKEMRPTPFRANVGFIRTSTGATHLPDNSFPCETDTSYCSAYSIEKAFAVYAGLRGGEFTVGFNRRDAAFDVAVPLTVSDGDMQRLGDCLRDIYSATR